MASEKIFSYIQNSKAFFIGYLILPFALVEVTKNTKIFYFYFIVTLLFMLAVCLYRIVNEEDKRDWDIVFLSVVKIANIATILYTPKFIWIVSGLIIFSLFLVFSYRHSRIGFSDIFKHKFFFSLYVALYLTLFFRSVHPDNLLLKIYGVQLAFCFAYLLLCALKTKLFYRGILFGAASIITLVLIGRYSVETLSMFYLYVESVFIGLGYVCYLNWYNHYVYLHYLPFVKKQAVHKFFDKMSLMNIIGIVALAVIVLNLPLTKVTIINSSFIAVFIWTCYSAVAGFLNLGENSKDIAEYEDDEEIINYYESLPNEVQLKIKNEIDEIRAREKRCKDCRKIFDQLNKRQKFIEHINGNS